MDFHGLARRQLQALCKANKIPANMTNVAMADALSALDNVEGIEEVMQPQSPEKADSGSPEVPRTVTRTSTRARKPPISALVSGGVVSQSRGGRTTTKAVDDDDKDVTKTPAVAGSRARAPAASSRKKADVPSVQKVYSTRRSVRLVEKQLSELCLGESKTRTQPIKIDNELSSEITESDVKGDNLAEISNETSIKDFTGDEVNSGEASALVVETKDTASVVLENEVARKVAAVEVEPEVEEEVAMKLDVYLEKGISSDLELDSVAMVEEASFDEIEESINEVMKMETEANRLNSDAPAANDNGNSNCLELKAELPVDETVNFEDLTQDVNGQEQMENIKSSEDPEEAVDSGEPLKNKPDAQLEQRTDLLKNSLPETENAGKENNVECFKVPKKQLEDMSMGELRKLLKGLNISKKNNKEGHANKHKDTPRPRHAFETLPDNTHV